MPTQRAAKQESLITDDGELTHDLAPIDHTLNASLAVNKQKKREQTQTTPVLKNSTFWIVSVSFTFTFVALTVFCEFFKIGILGGAYLWILLLAAALCSVGGMAYFRHRNPPAALGFLGGMFGVVVALPVILFLALLMFIPTHLP